MSTIKPIKLNWRDPVQFTAVHLAALGFSTKYITGETGLTPCQVQYRLAHANVRRIDFRNGASPLAKVVFDIAQKKTAGLLKYDLETFGTFQVSNGVAKKNE